MKIFQIKKEFNEKFTKYTICFFSLRISFKKIKFKNYNKFIKKVNEYKKSESNITKRIFFTSGNLSLINTIAIINQLNYKTNSENTILVWSHIANPEFEKINKRLSNLASPARYLKFCNCKMKNLYNFFINNFLVEYDEIYILNCRYMFKIANFLFPNKKICLIDEGVCTLYKHKNYDVSNVEKAIFVKYLDKIDTLGFDEEFKNKVITLDKQEFLKVAKQVQELYPLDIDLKAQDKNIILCGTTEGLGFWTFKEIFEYQNKIANQLAKNGYTVLFKPHPRDKFVYKERENFKLLKTKLPLECYFLENKCLGVVSLFSSVSSQIYYFHKIPGFCAYDFIANTNDMGIDIIKEYSPSYEMLLSVDAKTKSFSEVQKEILTKYENFLKNKPLMSENETLKNCYASFEPF